MVSMTALGMFFLFLKRTADVLAPSHYGVSAASSFG